MVLWDNKQSVDQASTFVPMQAELEDLSFAILQPQLFDCLQCQLRTAWFPPVSSAIGACSRDSEAVRGTPAATTMPEEPASCTSSGLPEAVDGTPAATTMLQEPASCTPSGLPEALPLPVVPLTEDLVHTGPQCHSSVPQQSSIVPFTKRSRQSTKSRGTSSPQVVSTPEHAKGAAVMGTAERCADLSTSSSTDSVSDAPGMPDPAIAEQLFLNQGKTDACPSPDVSSDEPSLEVCSAALDHGDGSSSAVDSPQALPAEGGVTGKGHASTRLAPMLYGLPQTASTAPAVQSFCENAGFEASSPGCPSRCAPSQQGLTNALPSSAVSPDLQPSLEGVVTSDRGDGSSFAADVPRASHGEEGATGKGLDASAPMPDAPPQSPSTAPAVRSSCESAGFTASSPACPSCCTSPQQRLELSPLSWESLGLHRSKQQGGLHVPDLGLTLVESVQADHLQATHCSAVGMIKMAGRSMERIGSFPAEEKFSEQGEATFRVQFLGASAGQPQQLEAEGEQRRDGCVVWKFPHNRPILLPNAEQLPVSPWRSTVHCCLFCHSFQRLCISDDSERWQVCRCACAFELKRKISCMLS